VVGAALMRCAGKLAVAAFVFLLAVVGMFSVQSQASIGTGQVDQEQEKLCLTCHSPRFLPNDTSQDHWRYGWDVHADGSPCYVCHGDTLIPHDEATLPHNGANAQHPTWDEAAAIGKSDLDCGACHYPHNITEELLAGSIAAPSPILEPTLTTWALTVVAVISLITGVSVILVLLSVRKRKAMKSANRAGQRRLAIKFCNRPVKSGHHTTASAWRGAPIRA
jgi:hypothetical protein